MIIQKFELLHDFIDKGRIWFYAIDDGQVVGAMSVSIDGCGGSLVLDPIIEWLWIPQIFVQESHRKRGIASALLSHFLGLNGCQGVKLGPNIKGVSAGIDRENKASQALFEKHGFRHCFTYDDGSLLYSRELPP